ncbi:hypothetical protein F4802DRAFT_553243, partial [Xylaria palmicola]
RGMAGKHGIYISIYFLFWFSGWKEKKQVSVYIVGYHSTLSFTLTWFKELRYMPRK